MKDVLTGEHFMNGDIACAEGAIAAGCRFFAGYPITPATEIAERMSRRLPEIKGIYIQMEDEIASMAAILGASWSGVKSMTATSGPGFSLMMENIGLGMMTETPCVVVDIMRAGPSTGLPTMVGQGDVMQAKWGSHGVYGVIIIAPASPQEMFDSTIMAFNLSEQYRLPVIILGDEIIGHMNEKVIIPPAEEIKLYNRIKPSVPPEEYLPFKPDDNLVPPMACAGEGYSVHVTGLTHDERGYPVMTAEAHEVLVQRLVDKIEKNAESIVRYEEFYTEDAEIVVVSYGCSAGPSMEAVKTARELGIKAGFLRLITLWPLCHKKIRELAPKIKAFIVPELNHGQMAVQIERLSAGKTEVIFIGKMGGETIFPSDILSTIKNIT